MKTFVKIYIPWPLPYLLVEKQAKYWNVTLAIAKELYFYQYPFQFPNFFVKYRNKYDFEVKLEIIRVFSTDNTEKIFCATRI